MIYRKLKKFLIVFMLIFILVTLNIKSYSATTIPDVLAQSAILIDSSSEKILYSKNETQKMYPASTTKILTAILTIENCNLSDIVSVPAEAVYSIPSGYTTVDLMPGEQLTVEQLLQLMLVHSANDAANVLAYHVSGSIEKFSELMNQKVADLGLKDTHFTNPSGLHNQNHYSTAYDLAKIMKYCMKSSTFRNLTNLKYCKIPATNMYDERIFYNTNELLLNNNKTDASNYYYPYAIAGKTGFTTEAQNCLVSVSNKDGLEFICVVLGDGLYPNNLSAKFIDTKSLYDYGYNNFTLKKVFEKNAVAKQIEISNGADDTKNLDLLVADDLSTLVSQTTANSPLYPTITLQDNLYAPIVQGQVVGKITYTIDGTDYSSDLVASHSVLMADNKIIIVQILLVIVILVSLYIFLFEFDKIKKLFEKK